jgi:hypothetical protein
MAKNVSWLGEAKLIGDAIQMIKDSIGVIK